jgi:hypothetical protein
MPQYDPTKPIPVKMPDGKIRVFAPGTPVDQIKSEILLAKDKSPESLGLMRPSGGENYSAPVPNAHKELGKAGLSGLSLAASFLPVGLPIETAIQTILGGAHGAVDGGLKGAMMEGGASALMTGAGSKPVANFVRNMGNKAALWTGVGGIKHGEEIAKGGEAFLRQGARDHKAGRMAMPVGAREKTKTHLKHTGNALQAAEESVPTITNWDEFAPEITAGPRTPRNKILGSTDPQGVRATIADTDKKFVEGNRQELLKQKPKAKPQGWQTNPNTRYTKNDEPFIDGDIVHDESKLLSDGKGELDASSPSGTLGFPKKRKPLFEAESMEGVPEASFRDLSEIGRAQRREGRGVYEKQASGQWIKTADSPANQAAKQRGEGIQDKTDEIARAFNPGTADDIKDLNGELTDLYTIKELNDAIRSGLWFGGTRGSLGSMAGAGIAHQTDGDATTGGMIGGALGVLGYPKNMSRLGNFTGTSLRFAQPGYRAVTGAKELERGTKRREPKK